MIGLYNESNYENAIINLFTDVLGYSYAYGPDIDRDYHDPLYEDLLLPALQRINPGLPIEALNEAVYKIKNFETGTLLQKNMTFTDYMQSGVPVKYFVNGEGTPRPGLSHRLPQPSQQRFYRCQPVDHCGELRETPGCDSVCQRSATGGGRAEVPLPGGDRCLGRIPAAAQLYV